MGPLLRAGYSSKDPQEKKIDLYEANTILNMIDKEKLKVILEPSNLLKLGYSLDDLTIS